MSTTLNPGAHTLATPRGRLDDGGSRTGFRRLLLGPPDQPTWARPGLLVLLVVAAILYLWDLSASGYSNSFYAAAVQAGTKNWTAFLFGSLDPGNAITVDKPPASLWVMALSGRIFGFNSWSLLVPNALEGVAAVGLLHAAVKRWSGPAAGLIAGSVFALTPVAVLMFRFDNPDSLLVLLEVAAAYCTVRATEKAGPKWLMLAGVALGFGFLTKLIQAFLVLPALALAYLIVAPAGIWKRIGHLLLAGVALVVSAGWLLVVEALWPSSSAPYIGGSTNNSLLELALGYNGLGRVFGGEGNGGGGGGGGGGMGGNTMFGGSTGLFRMFGDSFGTEISWLLPAALIALVGGLWFTRWQPRTDKTRAALIIWGGWLLVTVLVFSYMQGTIHPYYTIALAPAIGALVGIGGRELWRGRDHTPARYVLAAMVAATAIWDFILLDRDSSWQPWLRWVILVAGVLVGSAIVVGAHEFRRVGAVLLAAIVFTVGAASTAWGVDTASSPHSGSIPTSGPSSSGGFGGGPGGGGFGGGSGGSGGTGRRSGSADQGGFPSGATESGMGQLPTSGSGSSGSGSGGRGSGGTGGGSGGFTGGGGGMGGLGDGGGSTNSALAKLLTASKTRWAAAVSGSNQAASLELDLGVSVMAMGGFTGSDPYPTLAQFKQYVADGEISYYISGGGMGGGGMGGQNSISAITSWVEQNFTASTVGGETVYKLTK
ncbi:MAG TPA: glycosyltransferase family 39 protein [Pseudonocardiaceae bacterium]|jgi:4-amino-4-deoxy-L-arabinose transferase-like glycosyltransferase|nr:glycosyltransferase family 39 protein [Pseudonocardiaceae bacterium]